MRRALVGALAALVASLAPLGADAQAPAKVSRVGILRATGSPPTSGSIEELRRGLRELGYFEGRNIALEIRWAEGRPERLPKLAAELVRLNVDVIVTHGPPAIRAVKEATSTIPIVMARMDDADSHGFVASLARPGGNVTGLSFQSAELSGKWLELLREALPRASHVALLWDSTGTVHQRRAMEAAARSLDVQLQMIEVRSSNELDSAFEAARAGEARGLVILASPALTAQARRLAALAAKNRLPAIYYNRAFAEAGGLMAYGPKESDFSWRRAAVYVDKILKGARPADLPVEQPTRFELVVNLKTAKALGLAIPRSLLIRADEVIQ